MSYDLALYMVPEGMDPDFAIGALTDRDPAYPELLELNALSYEKRRVVVAALMEANPLLEAWPAHYAPDAQPAEDEEGRASHVELDAGERGTPVQISISGNQAGLSVAYGHTGEKARETFRDVWRYLEILQRETGYSTYDNQIGRKLDLERDFEDVVGAYSGSSAKLPSLIRESERKNRPWWKFW